MLVCIGLKECAVDNGGTHRDAVKNIKARLLSKPSLLLQITRGSDWEAMKGWHAFAVAPSRPLKHFFTICPLRHYAYEEMPQSGSRGTPDAPRFIGLAGLLGYLGVFSTGLGGCSGDLSSSLRRKLFHSGLPVLEASQATRSYSRWVLLWRGFLLVGLSPN